MPISAIGRGGRILKGAVVLSAPWPGTRGGIIGQKRMERNGAMILEDTGTVTGGPDASAAGTGAGNAVPRETLLLGAGLFILSGAFLYPYVERIADAITPGCLFHRVTGLPCLLCGMTRSLAATAHGNLGEAFRLHLLGPPLFLLVAVVTALLAVEHALSRRILPRPGTRAWGRMGWGILALLAAAWIARMVFFGSNL